MSGTCAHISVNRFIQSYVIAAAMLGVILSYRLSAAPVVSDGPRPVSIISGDDMCSFTSSAGRLSEHAVSTPGLSSSVILFVAGQEFRTELFGEDHRDWLQEKAGQHGCRVLVERLS